MGSLQAAINAEANTTRTPATKFIAIITSSAGGHLPLPSVLSAACPLCRHAGRTGLEREVGCHSLPISAESAQASPQGSSAPYGPSYARPRANRAIRTHGAKKGSLTPVVLVPAGHPRATQQGCAIDRRHTRWPARWRQLARSPRRSMRRECEVAVAEGVARPRSPRLGYAPSSRNHRPHDGRSGNLMARTHRGLHASRHTSLRRLNA